MAKPLPFTEGVLLCLFTLITTQGGNEMRWNLDDIVGLRELAEYFSVKPAAISNWTVRYTDFPAPLKTLRCGPLYSLRQVRSWYAHHNWSLRGGHYDI